MAKTKKSELSPVNGRFLFVVHPYEKSHFYRKKEYAWARFVPFSWVEKVASRMPPLVLGKIEYRSNTKRIEGLLVGLPDTPHILMSHTPEETYRKLEKAARMGEEWGAGIMGLGAYTSVVGDAGETLAKRVQIPVTTGNSLTVFATMQALSQVCALLGHSLSSLAVGVIGATGSIGSACSRLLSRQVKILHLIAPRPERISALIEDIGKNSPTAELHGYTHQEHAPIPEMNVLLLATSSRGNALDIRRVKSEAVLLDVALPHDVTDEMVKMRPDVFVLDAGEMKVPENFSCTFPLPLPDGIVYGCLAETMLLTLEGRWENYSLGREIRLERVEEIASLASRYGFTPAIFPRAGSLPLPTPTPMVSSNLMPSTTHRPTK